MNLKIKTFPILLILSIITSCTNDRLDTIDSTPSVKTENDSMMNETYLKK